MAAAAVLLAALLGVWLCPRGGEAAVREGAQRAPSAAPSGNSAAPALPVAVRHVAAFEEAGEPLAQEGPFTLVEHTPERIRIRFELPEYHLEEVAREDGTSWQAIVADAPGLLSVAGAPSLPAWRTDIALPPGYSGRVTLAAGDSQFLSGVIPPPGTGAVKRTEEAPADPVPSPIYYEGGVWPPQTVNIVAQYQVRGVAGVGISVTPFQYDAVRGGVSIVRSGEIVLESTLNESARLDADADWGAVQRLQFLNGPQLKAPARGAAAAGACGRLMVVVPDGWRDLYALQEFIQWKRALGFDVQTAGFPAETGEEPAAMKAFLQEAYDDPERNFTHLLLVGDYAMLPPFQRSASITSYNTTYEHVASDTPYALLAGEGDLEYMDAMLSRLPVPDEASLESALARLMETEQGAPLEASSDKAAWPGRGLFVGSGDSSPMALYPGQSAKNVTDHAFIAGLMDDAHLGGVLAETEVIFPDTPQKNAAAVQSALDEGASLMYYLGHGTCTALTFTGFNAYRAQLLSNGAARPFVIAPVCHAGNLDHGTEYDANSHTSVLPGEMCLAAALLNPADGVSGAAAVIAATNATYWHPPMVMLEKITQLIQLESDSDEGRPLSDGALFLIALNASIGYCDTYYQNYGSNYYAHADALYQAHVMHLYGDASALPRIAPYNKGMDVEAAADGGMTVVTVTSGGAPLVNAAVCLETAEGGFMSERTDADGRVYLEDEEASGLLRIADGTAPVVEKQLIYGAIVDDFSAQAMTQRLDAWQEAETALADDAAALERIRRVRDAMLACWRAATQKGSPETDAGSLVEQQLALSSGWTPLPLTLYPDGKSFAALTAAADGGAYKWLGNVFAPATLTQPGAYFVHRRQPHAVALTITGVRESKYRLRDSAGWSFIAPTEETALPEGTVAMSVETILADGTFALRRLQDGGNVLLEPDRCYWLWRMRPQTAE